jgi:hypothetical protein
LRVAIFVHVCVRVCTRVQCVRTQVCACARRDTPDLICDCPCASA